jgi:hypothetical protein
MIYMPSSLRGWLDTMCQCHSGHTHYITQHCFVKMQGLPGGTAVITDPGSIPGCVTAGCDLETQDGAYNWPSVVWVSMHADTVDSCAVFPPTHWCGWF